MPIARDFIPRQARRGPCGVMQAGIITCHTNLSSHQERVRADLGDIPAEAGLALCCEPWKVGRDMPVGLL